MWRTLYLYWCCCHLSMTLCCWGIPKIPRDISVWTDFRVALLVCLVGWLWSDNSSWNAIFLFWRDQTFWFVLLQERGYDHDSGDSGDDGYDVRIRFLIIFKLIKDLLLTHFSYCFSFFVQWTWKEAALDRWGNEDCFLRTEKLIARFFVWMFVDSTSVDHADVAVAVTV